MLVATLVVLGAPGVAVPSGTPAHVAAAADVQQLLDQRASAVRNRDPTRFGETIDPAAPWAFRDAELAMFANLAEVPLAGWD